MNNDEEVTESLSDKLKFQTIRKVFSERAEFIIIGLTGPIGGVIGEMTNVLAQDYGKRSNPCTYKSPEKFDITIIIQLHKLYDFNKLYNSYNYHKFFRRL